MIYFLIVVGFALLLMGGNFLIDGAVMVAKKLKVSPLLIGLVLIGFGTSTPELLTSLIAAYKHVEGIAVGNVVGSNIANIFLVLGVAALLRPVPVAKKSFKRDSLFLLLSTGVLIFALLWGHIGFAMGLLMCLTLAFYVFYSYSTEKEIPEAEETGDNLSKKSLSFALFKTVLGIGMTLYGAQLLVDNSVALATSWGVSEKVIGLTIVAIGTSLPELMTSIVASFKRQSAVALGNVIGSNIYNALFILGATALFLPVAVPASIESDVVVMTIATLLLLVAGFYSKCIGRKMGVLFLALYIAYLFYLGVYS